MVYERGVVNLMESYVLFCDCLSRGSESLILKFVVGERQNKIMFSMVSCTF